MRFLKILFVLSIGLICVGWGGQSLFTSGGEEAGLDWSTIELFWRMESFTMSNPGDCYSTDDTWSAGNTPTSISATAKYIGTYGLLVEINDDEAILLPTASTYDSSSFSVGWWMNAQALPADVNTAIYKHKKDNDEELTATLQLDGDIYVGYEGAAGTCDELYYGSAFDSPGWHFIQISIDAEQPAGSDYNKVYIDGVLFDSGTTNCSVTPHVDHDDEEIGSITGDDSQMVLWLDNLILSNDPTLNLYTSGHAYATSCP